ncbi:MAG: TIGR03943 family protein [Chloroflexi bacterium]|nr:TIGR03943 family protein [Chloroflexota bacterium]
MDRFLKTSILLLLGAFLFMRVMDGTVLYYINQRFVLLTWLAAGGFLLVAASYYLVSGQHAHAHAHDHDHGVLTWAGLLIVSLPLLLGWLVPPRPLGAAAIGNREINVGTMGSLTSVAPPQPGSALGLTAGEKNILDWLSDFQRQSDPAAFNGQEAHIIGFVYRDPRFADDTFMVARFTVSCCVADAAPIGLIVQWPDAAAIPADQWVEVTGHFAVGVFDGRQIPILVADSIVPTDPPAQPYLYL